MSLTLYLPIFIIFLIYACRGEREWALASIISSFAEAASPLLVSAGGRITGTQTVYLLIPIGMIHMYGSAMREARLRALTGERARATDIGALDRADAMMIMVTIIGVAGAVLLPRLFDGQLSVTSSTTGYTAVALHPSSKNTIQATYMVANAALYFLLSRSIGRGVLSLRDCLRALTVSTGVVICLGLYQLAGSFAPLPWPSPVINSNLAYSQLPNQGLFGIRRMSSTYTEPSVFAMHFVALFALFGLGLRRVALGGLILFCLLVSTSATGYAGMAILAVAYLWLTQETPATRVLFTSLFVASIAFVLVWPAQLGFESLSVGKLVLTKMQSHSGVHRGAADLVNIRALIQSAGLGVGIGSSRASSFLVTFVACTGLPGLVCLAAFFRSLLKKGWAAPEREMRALSLGCLGFISAWLVSVPDLTNALIWLMCAMLRGGTGRAAVGVNARHVEVQEARPWVFRAMC
jgi:hypothetical protein